MKKQLDTESVTNELRGASAFFRRREEPKAVAPQQTPRTPEAQRPRPPGVQGSRVPDPQTPRPPEVQSSSTLASGSAADVRFDLTERAREEQTLRLTEGEWLRLDRLTRELAAELGVRRVEKNDILRYGLHRLFTDLTGREKERILATLRKKYR